MPSFMAPDQVDHSDILLRCIVWIFVGCICIFGSGCLGSDFEDGKAGYTDWVVLWYPALCVSFTPTTQRQTLAPDSDDCRTLVGGPIGGALLSRDDGHYFGLIIFSGVTLLTGASSLVVLRMRLNRNLLAKV